MTAIRAAPAWRQQLTSFIDVAGFGETCVIPMRRGASGKPSPLLPGMMTAPRGAPGAVVVAELTRTRNQCLALSGPMVPRHAYPPGAERTDLPHFKAVDGVVDTGYPCQIDPETGILALTGPPIGIAGVGGYRFALRRRGWRQRRVARGVDQARRQSAGVGRLRRLDALCPLIVDGPLRPLG